jgi:hypothetical protein
VTDDLIDRLANDLRPARRGAVTIPIVAAIVVGIALAGLGLAWIGMRPDMPDAMMTPIFWVKFAYPALIAVGGFIALERLVRPGGSGRRGLFLVAAIFALSGILGIIQLAMSPPEMAQVLVMGGSALVCPFLIAGLSAPVFVATILAARRLAPTNLPLAGLAAGLLAGGVGAWVYSFHCGESGLPFLAIWYTLGIAIVTAVGALAGRWFLRW